MTEKALADLNDIAVEGLELCAALQYMRGSDSIHPSEPIADIADAAAAIGAAIADKLRYVLDFVDIQKFQMNEKAP